MNKLHPQLWELIIKSYRHAHQNNDYLINLLQALPLTIEFKGISNDSQRSVEDELQEFLVSLPLDDGLLIIEDALEDDSIRKMENDNWNYYGDFVNLWRGKIITYLEKSGIKYDEKNKAFYKLGDELKISSGITSKEEFISSIFDDAFYNDLKKEINRSYRFRTFTGTFVLSRKMIENLLIDILRLKFPPSIEGNLDLYFRKNDGGGRFHDFTILLKNLEDKKEDFGIDKEIIEEFLPLVKVFRPQANSKAHSIIIVGEEKDLINAKIEKMVELLLKLKQNIINDLRGKSF